MQDYLPKAIPNFEQSRVLVLGDIMLDRYWFGDTKRVSPEAPVPIVNVNNIDNRPGGAGNVALNLAALGAKVTLIGVLGDDEAAKTLCEHLTAANVDYLLTKEKEIATIIKLRVISRNQQLIRIDFEDSQLKFNAETLINNYKKALQEVDLVILSDYQKGTLYDPACFIKLAKKANVPVLVDPKNQNFKHYQGANVITPNIKEFEVAVGVCKDELEIIAKGRQLIRSLKCEALLITRGSKGMTLILENETLHLPAFAREVFDVTGAGDTVIATLGAALAGNATIHDAVQTANLAASLVVGKLGAATVTASELLSAIQPKINLQKGVMSNEDELMNAVNDARTQGKKIVFTNGCFDILHAGHVTYLQMAKKLGDFLIVAVNSDNSVKKLKGNLRPINQLSARLKIISSLDAVDWVIPFEDETPERLLRKITPDILVKGGDYKINEVVGADIVRSYGGEVRIMNHSVSTTSSEIINQMKKLEVVYE